MHLGGAGGAQHADKLLGRVAAHDAVVDDDQALAGNDRRQRIELDADAHLPHFLGGLDERASNVAVLDDAVRERDAAFFGIAQGRGNARVGYAHDQVRINGRFPCELAAHGAARFVDALAVDRGVSDETTQPRPSGSSPRQSGRMPFGSRNA